MYDPTLAIIGTAGRQSDKAALTPHHYPRMLAAAITFIEHHELDRNKLRLFSGGAAWADHLVVSLALHGVVNPKNVTIFLPSRLTEQGYVGEDDRSSKTASTANYYHKLFATCTGKDPIKELLLIQDQGAILIPGTGSFHARNSDVAKSVSSDGHLLAYTFGSPDSTQPIWTIRSCGRKSAEESGLKDGGTADTWNKAKCNKHHARLGPTDSVADQI